MGNFIPSNPPREVRYACDYGCGCADCDPYVYDNSPGMNTTQSYGFTDYSPDPVRGSYNSSTYVASRTPSSRSIPTASRSSVKTGSLSWSEPRPQPQIIPSSLAYTTSRPSISTNCGAPARTQLQPQTSLRSPVSPSNPIRSATSSTDRRIIDTNWIMLPSTSWSIPAVQPSSVYPTAPNVNRPSTSTNVPKSLKISSTTKETWPSFLFEESVDEVSNRLECSICLDLCSGKIRQCKNGHNICETHTSQISICPICRVSYNEGSSRNLLAEKLVVQERSKLEMKEQQQKLLDNVDKLRITKKEVTF